MATSYRAFLVELYEEYLEEASFLYAQRKTLYQNPEISWRKIGEFEERLEAHIDGLVVGDKLALDVCRRHASAGDFGELYAAICVFCRQERRDLVLAILDQLAPDDPEKASAAADALKYELPDAWFPDFLLLLSAGDPKLAPILARAFGYRRLPSGPELLAAMRKCAASALPEVVWALGRIRHEPARERLLDVLQSEDEPARSAAALALLRMGESRAIDFCSDYAKSTMWPIVPLGLAGGSAAQALLSELARKTAGGDHLMALGLLGDPVSVPFLMTRLEQEEAAPWAALALQCLTGAGLSETVFVPDEVDEDELFEAEREELKAGKMPTRGDGRPFGSKVKRISQKTEDWDRWWRSNERQFSPGVRYRNGGPISPRQLTEMLSSPSTPYKLRRCCSEEVAIRYGKEFRLELDAPVARQVVSLAEMAAWSQACSGQFHDGAWYFAGSRIP